MFKRFYIEIILVILILGQILYGTVPQTIRTGTTRNIPQTGEESWGDEVTNWIIDATTAINASSLNSKVENYDAIVGSATQVSNGYATYTNLNSAINSIATNGGSIYINDGTYFQTSTVVINSPIYIQGHGVKTVIAAGPFLTSGVVAEFATSGITIKDLEISSGTGTPDYAVKFDAGFVNQHLRVALVGSWNSGAVNNLSSDRTVTGEYSWSSSSGVFHKLESHPDVSISTRTNGDLLVYNGTQWVNKSLAGVSNEIDVNQTGTQISIGIVDPLIATKGGTGLSAIGTSNQVLGVNNGTTGLEYKTITAGSGVTVTHGVGSVTLGSPFGTSVASGIASGDITNWNTAYYQSGVWLTSVGHGIASTDVLNWNTANYRAGVWATSVGQGIVSTDISNWNTAKYKTDIWDTSVSKGITSTNITNWNTGYYQSQVWLTGTQPVNRGGTAFTTTGQANDLLGTNGAANGLEYKKLYQGPGIGITQGTGWITIGVSGSTGITPIANGGTNNTVIGNNQIVYGKSTYMTSNTGLTYDGTSLGIGVSPVFPLDIETNYGGVSTAKFGSDRPLYFQYANPAIDFNLYNEGTPNYLYRYGKFSGGGNKYGAQLIFDANTGIFSFLNTNSSGATTASATLLSRLDITPAGAFSFGGGTPASQFNFYLPADERLRLWGTTDSTVGLQIERAKVGGSYNGYWVSYMGSSSKALNWGFSGNLKATLAETSGLTLYDATATNYVTQQIPSTNFTPWTFTWPTSAGSNTQVLTTNGSGVGSWYGYKAPKITTFTTSSGIFTSSTNVVYTVVKMCGAGGGGGGSGTSGGTSNAGLNGGTTNFNTSGLIAPGGSGAPWAGGGAGGTIGTVTYGSGFSVAGGKGTSGSIGITANAAALAGAKGGSSVRGGAGAGGDQNGVGGAAATNSCSGGGGGGNVYGSVSDNAGGGGGAGAYLETYISSPAATYWYTVGLPGKWGTASTNGYQGGYGGDGWIFIEEHYQ